jgi:D-xylose transport system substrate-binding protein
MITKFLNTKLFVFVSFLFLIVFSGFKQKEHKPVPQGKVKIGFLIHDLVSERWKKDTEYFTKKIEELGGEPMLRCAYGVAQTQIDQGKQLIDEGVKVISIVAVDGKVLGELVDYADKAGVKVIAYDRLILNCNLHYYISFNSIKVGELMTEYVVKRRPKGNYAIINGPPSDNNSIFIRKGQMNILKPYIDRGDIKIVLDKSVSGWGPLEAMLIMDNFLSANKDSLNVVLVASDVLSEGIVQSFSVNGDYRYTLVTGQDASLTACRNILAGGQTMSVFKSIQKIASEAAEIAMKLGRNETVVTKMKINNGKRDVPSFLFDAVVVDKDNVKEVVVGSGHIKESDLE